MPEVSVVVPVFRVERYLRRCLDSVLAQSFRDFELICVDDASSDGCPEILREYADRDPRVKVLTHSRNLGLSAARNTGLGEARGEFVYFLDSDDWIEPDYLFSMLDAARASGAEVVMNQSVSNVDESLRITGEFVRDGCRRVEEGTVSADEAAMKLLWNVVAYLYRREFLDRHGLTFPVGYTNEDIYFTWMVLAYADRVHVICRSRYNYLSRAGSITRSEGEWSPSGPSPLLAVRKRLVEDLLERGAPLRHPLFEAFGLMSDASGGGARTALRGFFELIVDEVMRHAPCYSADDIDFMQAILRDSDLKTIRNIRSRILMRQLRRRLGRG